MPIKGYLLPMKKVVYKYFSKNLNQLGGFHMNRENDDKIKEVFQSIMKKIGKKILEGKISDIMKISKPIQMCYPLSFLEAIAKFIFSL